MRSHHLSRHLPVVIVAAGILLFSACSVSVKKDADGKEKNVEIDTPIARLHVDKGPNASDTGLSVYPGSRRVEDGLDGNEKGATVSILTGLFGLKVVAVKYQTDDSVEKVKDYYRSQLQQYGNYLECRANTVAINPGIGDDSHSNRLVCEQNSGNNIELKAGTRNNQHAVAIEPLAKGCKYALVYLQMHSDNDSKGTI
jgi:hypothetical protein